MGLRKIFEKLRIQWQAVHVLKQHKNSILSCYLQYN